MRHFNSKEINEMESRYRATFINSIGGFKSVCLIGTKNKQHQTNLAIFNSLIHIGSHPPLIGFVIRPNSVERHTLENILETKYYTINHINEKIYNQAHQTSARYPRHLSEFKACQLNEEYLHDFYAPFVEQSQIKIGVEMKSQIDISINGTILIIGEILEVFLPAVAINQDGFIDLEACGTVTNSGLDSYHLTKKLNRLSYAKPEKWPLPL